MIAVGHPGVVEDLPPNLRVRELAPRQRRPIEEIAFGAHWEHGY